MPVLQFGFTYSLSLIVLFLFSILFLGGAYASILPLIAFVPAVVLKKALFTPRFEEDLEVTQ